MSKEISPYDFQVVGQTHQDCRNHQKQIMLSFAERGTAIYKVLLSTEQAEEIHHQLGERLKENAECKEQGVQPPQRRATYERNPNH